jgi:hypothetical protein
MNPENGEASVLGLSLLFCIAPLIQVKPLKEMIKVARNETAF